MNMRDYIECKQCKFYKICEAWSYLPNQNSGTDVHTFCMYPENIRSTPGAARIIFKSAPSIINKNHNCNWFQPKDPHKTYVWDASEKQLYKDHGAGTFNVNPVGGIDGIYIGEEKLSDVIEDAVDLTEVKQDIAALKISVAGHDTQITQLNTNVSNIQVSVAGHDTRITEIESEIDDIDNEIVILNQKVDAGIIQTGTWITGGDCAPAGD